MCIDTDDADVGVDIDTGIDLIVAFVYKVTILSHYPNICHVSVFKDYKTYIKSCFHRGVGTHLYPQHSGA